MSSDRRREGIWLFGICASLFGSEALYLSFVVWIQVLTGSAALGGLAVFTYFAPSVLSPALGWVVDRLPRRPLLVCADLAQAGWVCLALLVRDAGDVWLLYVVLIGLTIGSRLETPAAGALLAATAGPERLGRLTSIFRTGKDLARIAAPGLGVFIGQAAGMPTLIILDAVTFLVSALCVWQLKTREARPAAARGPLWQEVSAGARHIAGTPLLRRVVGTIGVAMLVYGMRQPALIFALSRGLRTSPGWLGTATMVVNAGAVSGGLLCVKLIDRAGAARLVRVGLLVLAAGAVPLAIPHLATVLVACFVIGVGGPVTLVGYLTTVAEHTPGNLRGRVLAAADAAVVTPQALSAGVGAGLLVVVPYQAVVVVMALAAGSCAATLTKRRLRPPAPQSVPAVS